jgi:hypothetical protein
MVTVTPSTAVDLSPSSAAAPDKGRRQVAMVEPAIDDGEPAVVMAHGSVMQ